jgi:hypothetical protein
MAATAVPGWVASPGKISAWLPKIFFASAQLSSFRPTATTCAPFSIKAFAADKPNPVVPPMMTIFLWIKFIPDTEPSDLKNEKIF